MLLYYVKLYRLLLLHHRVFVMPHILYRYVHLTLLKLSRTHIFDNYSLVKGYGGAGRCLLFEYHYVARMDLAFVWA